MTMVDPDKFAETFDSNRKFDENGTQDPMSGIKNN